MRSLIWDLQFDVSKDMELLRSVDEFKEFDGKEEDNVIYINSLGGDITAIHFYYRFIKDHNDVIDQIVFAGNVFSSCFGLYCKLALDKSLGIDVELDNDALVLIHLSSSSLSEATSRLLKSYLNDLDEYENYVNVYANMVINSLDNKDKERYYNGLDVYKVGADINKIVNRLVNSV